jgi:F0F1-type ATP synthase assembly protein I
MHCRGSAVSDHNDQGEAPQPPQLGLAGLAGLGFANAVCLGAGLFLGHVADARFGTTPVLVLVGLVSGLGLGVGGSFLQIRRYLRQ